MEGSLIMKRVLFETDWLASRPIFYNEKTGQASHNINHVIDYANLEFHPEGFNNYLDFGYSVLEQTMIKHVKFLRHSSRLWMDEQGVLSVEYLDDPVEQWLDYRLSEKDVINLIRERVQEWEHSIEGEIVIPTSGGNDSRLLNWCIEDKSRVRSFTYGASENQAKSSEVIYARKLSEILGTRWEQIPLGDYHQYLDDWDRLFGVSTHAHGMYHFEFYQKILPKVAGGNPLLSGIIGDAWAGNVNITPLTSCAHVKRLGYTHGMQADSTRSRLSGDSALLSNYWETQRDRLEDARLRVVEAMRFKMILLCYLRNVPEHFGFKPWSPFLDVDACMAMLNLLEERRRDRVWQKEFFRKVGLGLEAINLRLRASQQNTLNLQALRRIPVEPLDVNLLREVMEPDYVEWINHNLRKQSSDWTDRLLCRLLSVPKLEVALRRLGFRETNRQLKPYLAYIVLLPIEKLLRKRNQG
jgi:hypothetical protein